MKIIFHLYANKFSYEKLCTKPLFRNEVHSNWEMDNYRELIKKDTTKGRIYLIFVK